jgi:alkyl sulfatase BDS1-like metallo-beta-lactamase superfamily hydrolase
MRIVLVMLVGLIAVVGQDIDLRVPVSIDPELREHTRLFDKKIYRVAGNVYCAVGYGLANIILIEGTDGTIVVDTGIDVEQGREVVGEFSRITTKPLKAIIYTHHHADHVQGTAAFVGTEKIEIIAHDSLVREYLQETLIAGEIMRNRAGAMYNGLLSKADNAGMSSGIGPLLQMRTVGFVPPTKTFSDHLDVTIAGVDLKLVYVPSEANSEIAVFLPQNNVLLSAEVIQDHTFPNLYTLRGAVYRDPMTWVHSIDRLRAFGAEHMVLQHGPPVSGKYQVATVLLNYRDAIQFVRDQTIRYMNQGLAPDEIADIVQLPPHLAEFSPWLREFYGTVRHSIPNIYHGNIGWFEGDPVTLKPTPRVEYARRLIALMGGRERVLAEARKAYRENDPQYSAELATYLIRVKQDDREARVLKAACFRRLGYATKNANWRGLYLTLANSLDGSLDWTQVEQANRGRSGNATLAAALPAGVQLETLPPRLKAEKVLDVDEAYGLLFKETGEAFTVSIRRGIAEVAPGLPKGPYAVLSGPKAALGQLISGAADTAALLGSGAIEVHGPEGAAKRFVSYFEEVFTAPVTFYLR